VLALARRPHTNGPTNHILPERDERVPKDMNEGSGWIRVFPPKPSALLPRRFANLPTEDDGM